MTILRQVCDTKEGTWPVERGQALGLHLRGCSGAGLGQRKARGERGSGSKKSLGCPVPPWGGVPWLLYHSAVLLIASLHGQGKQCGPQAVGSWKRCQDPSMVPPKAALLPPSTLGRERLVQ